MNNRIGVYICHCGGNISDVVDIETVKNAIAKTKDVVSAKSIMFACADSGQQDIIDDVKTNNIDAIVVASCSPKLHLYTFRAVAERAKLNFNQYIQVNIREQDSWAHPHSPKEATEKAIHLIEGSIAKVKLLEPLEPLSIPAQDSVLVVGAGISGIKAALDLANMGLHVHLIEKEHVIGGMTRYWDRVYPTGEKGLEVIQDLEEQLRNNKNVHLYTGTELVSKSGSVGDFTIRLRKTPTYLEGNPKLEDIQKAIEVCPVEVPDPQTFNLTKRKAIYITNKDSESPIGVIDMSSCTKCEECLSVCKEVNLQLKSEEISVRVGAILLCTGSSLYEPAEDEYGWQKSKQIITLAQFRMLLAQSNGQLQFNNRKIKNVAYIYCVGVMQKEGDHSYCSRYCCTAALYTAILAKNKYPDIRNFHFNQGIRSYGKQEKFYHQASEQGDIFLQWGEDGPPEVSIDNDKILIRINDILTNGTELELEADIVVLVTGMTANPNQELNAILKTPIGRDGFYNEVHPKLRPVETVLDGIFIGGASQGPKNISESVKSSLSAAAKINALLGAREIKLDPIQAFIDTNKCTWCGECEKACPYNAIEKVILDEKAVAGVIKSNCKGCGMCLPVCPENAIDLTNYTDIEMEVLIESLL